MDEGIIEFGNGSMCCRLSDPIRFIIGGDVVL